jgi:hypothetical protein
MNFTLTKPYNNNKIKIAFTHCNARNGHFFQFTKKYCSFWITTKCSDVFVFRYKSHQQLQVSEEKDTTIEENSEKKWHARLIDEYIRGILEGCV